MLRWRLSLGTVFIAALVGLGWLDFQSSWPGAWLMPLAVVLSLAASGEVLGLLAARGLRPLAWVVYGGNLLIVLSNLMNLAWRDDPAGDPLHGLGWPCSALAVGILLAFAGELHRYERPGQTMESLALAVFSLGYVGLLLSFVIALRLVGQSGTGLAALASLVIVVKMGDIGAYTVGRLVGRHKMSPRISPGKTIEGAIGGLVFACAGAYLALEWLAPALAGRSAADGAWWRWAVFGLVVGAVGMMGDLAESLIKRDVGCKDSSLWLPGFGGVLDLLDSILAAAPVAYWFWVLGWVR